VEGDKQKKSDPGNGRECDPLNTITGQELGETPKKQMEKGRPEATLWPNETKHKVSIIPRKSGERGRAGRGERAFVRQGHIEWGRPSLDVGSAIAKEEKRIPMGGSISDASYRICRERKKISHR